MWRFLVFPLITSILVVVESSFYVFSALISWLWVFAFFLKGIGLGASTPLPTINELFEHALWANSHFIEPHWPALMGAGLLLGLGLAGWETASVRVNKVNRSLWGLVLNAFWLGCYLFLLTSPLAAAIQFLSMRLGSYNGSFDESIQFCFIWSGFLVVLLAGVCFVNSSQVFSPKTILRRIRFGRFNTLTG